MTTQKISGDVVVSNFDPNPDTIDASVANYSNATLAMLAVADRFGIAVNYMDRGVVESKLDRPLTDEQWQGIAPHLTDSYDQRIDDTWNVSDVQGEFVWECVKQAGLTIEGGE